MRVLIIHTTYKQRGGEDSVLANEVELLRAGGIDVRLLTFSNDGGTFAKFLQLPFNYGAYRETLRIIDAFKPDLAHVHNLHYGGSASVIYALKKKQVPAVMTLHNYRLLCPSGTLFNRNRIFLDSVRPVFPWAAVREKVYLNSWFFTFWTALSMMIHQRCGTWLIPARYIVLGQHTKEIFSQSKLESIVSRMVVKPNFCPPSSAEVFPRGYYLYIGRLSEEKGINVLLSAFAENGLRLLIAGTGPLVTEVNEVAALHKHIEFLGPVSPQDAALLVKGAKALIFPSLWYETFGMVIIEAFAAGTPVIASSLGQLQFTVDDQINGLHFDAGDALDLTAKVNKYEQIGEDEKVLYQKNAKEKYDQYFAPKRNFEQLVALYQDIMRDKEPV